MGVSMNPRSMLAALAMAVLGLAGCPEATPSNLDHATYPALGWDCEDHDADIYPGNGC
jgi:hypothetical protein